MDAVPFLLTIQAGGWLKGCLFSASSHPRSKTEKAGGSEDPPAFSSGFGLSRKNLHPVIPSAAFIATYADVPEIFAQDICPVPAGIHPALHHLLRGLLPGGNVFPLNRYPVRVRACCRERSGKIAPIRAGMAEGSYNLPAAYIRSVLQPGHDCQRSQPLFCPFLVHQPHHFAFKPGDIPR